MILEPVADLERLLNHEDVKRILAKPDHLVRIITLAGRYVFASNGPAVGEWPQPASYKGKNAYDDYPAEHAMLLEKSRQCYPEHAALLHMNPARDGAEIGWLDVHSQVVGKFVVTLVRPATKKQIGWEPIDRFIDWED